MCSSDLHRQNHIAVLTAHIHIAQAIVGNVPDKANEFVVCAVVHADALNRGCWPRVKAIFLGQHVGIKENNKYLVIRYQKASKYKAALLAYACSCSYIITRLFKFALSAYSACQAGS